MRSATISRGLQLQIARGMEPAPRLGRVSLLLRESPVVLGAKALRGVKAQQGPAGGFVGAVRHSRSCTGLL